MATTIGRRERVPQVGDHKPHFIVDEAHLSKSSIYGAHLRRPGVAAVRRVQNRDVV